MIKIEKDLSAIPQSLIPAYADFFPNAPRIPVITRNTHQKRMEIINGGQYIDLDRYNSMYKRDDIKKSLTGIYKCKCAYCEMKVEQSNVEHYRPKKIYYWLAFSWDNLILSCSTCNGHKGINFDLDGIKVDFINDEESIRSINNSSEAYDQVEQPRMVNPEKTDPLGQITFTRNGLIESNNPRFAYTIEKCRIDRSWLNNERKHLLDVFERDITSAFVENDEPTEQKSAIATIVRKFIHDSEDLEQIFLAFRRFSISSGLLNQIVKKMN